MSNSPATAHEFIQATSPEMDLLEDSDDEMSFTGSVCKARYEECGKSKWSLFTMLVGLIASDGRHLGDTEAEPYRNMKFRKVLVPTSQQYRNEVTRRCKVLGLDAPQCKYWNKEKLTAWLKQNPIVDLVDRQWLLEEEKSMYTMLTRAEEEKNAVSTPTGWTDNKPWMRLYSASIMRKKGSEWKTVP